MKKIFLLSMSLLVSLTSVAKSRYNVIDIVHHFGNRTMFDAWFLETQGCTLDEAPEDQRAICYTTLDLGEGRIAAMDAAGVDFAQLSLSTPGAEAYGPAMGKQIAREANDSIAKAIAKYPDRIGGWMTLYPEDVEWSLEEIDRCANMGLYGWACLSNMNGKRLDDPKYWPIFKKLEELGMPVYIQSTYSKDEAIAEFGYCINGPALGFQADALTTFMRMVCRGLFDECPNLKIILGHDGEGLPFFKDRINAAVRRGLDRSWSVICEYQHEPSYYVDHNVWITTSGNFSNEALRCSLYEMPAGHVMMSTDYPYEDFAASVSFIRDNQKLTNTEKCATLSNNAIALGFSNFSPMATLNSKGFATYSSNRDEKVATEGVTAYKASVDGTTITLTAIAGNSFPAGTGVILYGGEEKAGLSVAFEAPEVAPADVAGNALLATTSYDGTLATKPASGYTFALGNADAFLHYTGSAFANFHAYLHFDEDPAPSAPETNTISIVFGDEEVTGIDVVANQWNTTANNKIMMLNGAVIIVRNGINYNVTGQMIE